MTEAIHLGTFSVTEWHNSLVQSLGPKDGSPVPLRELTARHLFDQARNFARAQSAGQIKPSTLDWAERVVKERWSIDVIWQTGETETLIFDGAFGWPLNVDIDEAKERFK